MSDYVFNVPPGWPIPNNGTFTPREDWRHDPTWPDPPAGWVFWIPRSELGKQPTSSQTTPPVPGLSNAPQFNQTPLPHPEHSTSLHNDDRLEQLKITLQKLNLFNTGSTKKNALHQIQQLITDHHINETLIKGKTYRETHDFLERQKAQQENLLATQRAAATQQLNEEIVYKEQLIHSLDAHYDEIVLNESSLHAYYHPAEDSVALQHELNHVQAQVKEMIKGKYVINAATNFTFNNSQAEGRKFVKDFSDLMLTAYNQDAENSIVKATGRSSNLQAALNRLEKAEQKIRKLGTRMNISVNPHFHALRKREIELAFMFKEKLAAEKEAEREHKAKLREEAQVLKEAQARLIKLEQQQAALQKEIQDKLDAIEQKRVDALNRQGSHYANVIQQLPENDPAIIQLKQKLAEIETAKQRNQNTLANVRAGYVYVISNIGSFGEGVVKIGLTRRQEPMERVKELGGASVPFHFDVHALHFSDDAVGLENALHRHFEKQSVNKVNLRKEFFRVSPIEVREAMRQLSNGTLLSFTDSAAAVEYRTSQSR